MNRARHSEPQAAANDEDLLNVNEDRACSILHLSSPSSSRAPTGSTQCRWNIPSTLLYTQHEQPTPSLSPSVQQEHTMLPPLPPPPPPPPSPSSNIQSEHTIPPPSSQTIHATLLSQLMTPSSSHSGFNRELLLPPQLHARLPVAPFRQGYMLGPKPKAADYQDNVEKMLLRAMHEYACLILATNTFPNEGTQT